MELKHDESHLEPLPEFKEGLVEIVQEQIKQRAVKNALEEALRDLENGILPGDREAAAAKAAAEAQAGGTAPDAADGTAGADGAAAMPIDGAPVEGIPAAEGLSEAERAEPEVRLAPGEEPDPIADAALRDLMKRMREAGDGASGDGASGDETSHGEVSSQIPEDED
jgi:hypothetical protein